MFLMDYYLVWLVVKGLLPDGGDTCGWFLRVYYLMAAAAVGRS